MSRRSWWWLVLSITALALAASANSVGNGFAYDDVTLIATADRVHTLQGLWSEFTRSYWPDGDAYRPLTVIVWRLEWVFGGGSPSTFHLISVALHVATSLAVLWLASAMLPIAAAWFAAALFAVHPVHVEAIANVAGQSELFVALFVVVAVGIYLRARAHGAVTLEQWIGIGALFATACLFKEHAIVLPVLIVVAELTSVRDRDPLKLRLARARAPLLAIALVAVLFLWLRTVVLGDISGFRPFVVFDVLNISARERVLTMIGASTEWARLLLWPARLVTQYTPPYIAIARDWSLALLPGAFLTLAVIALCAFFWRRSAPTSFGLAWFMIALLPASNFIVAAGFIIAERTLYLPSVGVVIALGSAVPWLYQRLDRQSSIRIVAASAAVLLLALGVARSITRNRVWRDDDTLNRQSVLDAPDSYRTHFMLGAHLFSIGDFTGGEREYRRGIELFPQDRLMAYAFAEQLRTSGRCDAAVPIYRWLFELQPDSRRGHIGYAACMLERHEYAEARHQALEWIRKGGRLSLAREVLASSNAQRDSLKR